jgi:hypothetical protein
MGMPYKYKTKDEARKIAAGIAKMPEVYVPANHIIFYRCVA